MKHIFYFALFFIYSNGISQPKLEYCTSQCWLSGECCSGGTKYHIKISGSKDVIESITITSVGIQANIYEIPTVTKIIQHKDSTSYMLVEFNYTYTRIINEKFIDKQVIEKPKRVEEGIFYTLHGVKAKLEIGKIEMLPPLEYPIEEVPNTTY